MYYRPFAIYILDHLCKEADYPAVYFGQQQSVVARSRIEYYFFLKPTLLLQFCIQNQRDGSQQPQYLFPFCWVFHSLIFIENAPFQLVELAI